MRGCYFQFFRFSPILVTIPQILSDLQLCWRAGSGIRGELGASFVVFIKHSAAAAGGEDLGDEARTNPSFMRLQFPNATLPTKQNHTRGRQPARQQAT